MRHDFPYAEIVDEDGEVSYAPYLRVLVIGPREALVLDMLVDSGADETCIDRETAEILGIEPTGERRRLENAIGTEEVVEIGYAEFRISRLGFLGRVAISRGKMPLLGRRDLFKHFRSRSMNAVGCSRWSPSTRTPERRTDPPPPLAFGRPSVAGCRPWIAPSACWISWRCCSTPAPR